MANDETRLAGWLCGFVALAASSLAQAVDCSHVTATGAILTVCRADVLTLYEFATIFRDVLKCPNALYLDGSVSSVYAPSLKEHIQRADLGPIIAVVDTVPATTHAR